jgi:hypothetical protein
LDCARARCDGAEHWRDDLYQLIKSPGQTGAFLLVNRQSGRGWAARAGHAIFKTVKAPAAP